MAAIGRRKPLLRAGLLLLAALLAVAVALFQISKARCFSLSLEAICRVETREPVVALTFDDGPTAEGVALASDALRRAGGHATFFLIGNQLAGHERLVRRLLDEGHEIGNHSFSHQRMLLRSSAFYDEEIARTDALLRRAGVASPNLFRPPYGKKLLGLSQAIARHRYRMIMWDVEDPPGAIDPRDYAGRIVREARPGSIILMHIMYRGNGVARQALPLVVEGLQAKGLRVVTVGELLRRRSGTG